MYPYKFEYYRFQLVPKKVVQLSIDNVAYTMPEGIHSTVPQTKWLIYKIEAI